MRNNEFESVVNGISNEILLIVLRYFGQGELLYFIYKTSLNCIYPVIFAKTLFLLIRDYFHRSNSMQTLSVI